MVWCLNLCWKGFLDHNIRQLINTPYVDADDIISSALTYILILIHVDNADGLIHLHKYIRTLYVYSDDIISSALIYILIHVDCKDGLSHLPKYI